MWFSKAPHPAPISYEEIVLRAIDGLNVPDQLGALTNALAQVLAENNVLPGMASYESFSDLLVVGLAGRVDTIARELAKH